MKLLGRDLVASEDWDKRVIQSLALLGQSPWSAPSPAGWPDRGAQWIGPEAMMRRLEWAKSVADRAARHVGPIPADQIVVAGPATRQALDGAKGQDALFLLLACREFQRR